VSVSTPTPTRHWLDAAGALTRGSYRTQLVADLAITDPQYLRQLLAHFNSLTADDRTAIEVALSQATKRESEAV
jgi:hypothetical protein